MDLGSLLRIRAAIVVMVAIQLVGYAIGSGVSIAYWPGSGEPTITALIASTLIDIELLVRIFHPHRNLPNLWMSKSIGLCICLLVGFFALCFGIPPGRGIYAFAVFVGLVYLVVLTALVLIFHRQRWDAPKTDHV